MRHLVTMCCLCEKIRDDREAEPGMGVWQEFKIYMAKYMLRPGDIRFTHTYCPGCLTDYRAFLVSREATHRTEKGGKT